MCVCICIHILNEMFLPVLKMLLPRAIDILKNKKYKTKYQSWETLIQVVGQENSRDF